jgi:hypothetical protein
MSPFVSILADLLVGCLLVACIVTSVRLSRRMAAMKADEGAMRQTVTELVLATQKADAAIAALRATVTESEQALADRLGAAARHTERLAQEVLAGEAVIERVSRIAAISRRLASEEAAAQMPEPVAAPVPAPAAAPSVAPELKVVPGDSLRAAIRLAREAASRHGRAA